MEILCEFISRLFSNQMDLVHKYKPHTHFISSVCVTADNKYVVSGSLDKTVRITRLDTGKLVHVIKGNTNWVSSVCVTSDNKYVVSFSSDKTVGITCLDTGELVREIKVFNSTTISNNYSFMPKFISIFE